MSKEINPFKQPNEILRQLKERLLNPDFRKSSKDLGGLLADDFIEIGISGRVNNKKEVIETLRQGSARGSLVLDDFKVMNLSPGVNLVFYRVLEPKITGKGKRLSFRSSIWKLQNGRWRMFFHYGTVVNI